MRFISRAAEDELMEVATERDKMVPQLQELAWQNRNLERQHQELRESAEAAEQVRCWTCGQCSRLFASLAVTS